MNTDPLDAYMTTVRKRWIDKYFHMEEINGNHICPTYLYRWTLIKAKNWRLYVHHFVGDDWAIDPHDHPKNFYCFGFWGSYEERYRNGTGGFSTVVRKAPFLNIFPAKRAHRIVCQRSCWTLVVVGKSIRNWGFFLHDHQWWDFSTYIKKYGEGRKSCGDS